MSLTKRIVGLVALALMPALAIQGYNEYALRAARSEAVRAEAMRTARSVAADLGQFGRGVRQALGILAEVPEIRGKDHEVCTPYLRTLLDKVPGAFFFAVVDTDGSVVCNTLGSARSAYSLANRRYFQDALRTGGFVVGEHTRGRITDKPTIQLAQALAGPDGHPEGVLVASIDLDYLAGQQARAGLPYDATLTVADKAGVPFTGLWLEAPAEIMARRVTERQRNVSDADAKILGQQLTYDLGEIEWFRIDSSGPRQETLKAGLGLIGLETGVA